MADKTDNVKDLIEKSGNSFHCKVVRYFRDKKWEVVVSPYYLDGISNKPREIDIIAEKSYQYKSTGRNGFTKITGDVIIRLFIECKFITQLTAFWLSERDFFSAKQWVKTNTNMQESNDFFREHHYLDWTEKVAKLFASNRGAKGHENEPIYSAINQSLNAMVSLRGREVINKTGSQNPQMIIEMPIIICNSFKKFHSVEMENQTDPEPIKSNFQIEVNYAYLNRMGIHRQNYFLIDVVSFEKINDFLLVIDKDIKAIFDSNSLIDHFDIH